MYCPTGYPAVVCRIAYRLRRGIGRYMDVQDLIQAGMLGWTTAERRYDATKGASLSTYAGQRALGAMIDEIRTTAWFGRRPGGKTMDTIEHYDEAEGDLGSVDRDMEQVAFCTLLAPMLDKLPALQRDTMRKLFADDLKIHEVAAAEGVTDSAIWLRRRDALETIRRRCGL